MAHLWVWADSQWAILSLEGEPLVLADDPEAPVRFRPAKGAAAELPVLVSHPTSGGAQWALLAGRSVECLRVNGDPLPLGIRVLGDRDEVRLGSLRVFFSTERLSRVVPFPAHLGRTYCARCKMEVEPGSPAVQCPQCEVWHHRSDEYPCWTYAPHCALCDQPTDSQHYRWSPEDL